MSCFKALKIQKNKIPKNIFSICELKKLNMETSLFYKNYITIESRSGTFFESYKLSTYNPW